MKKNPALKPTLFFAMLFALLSILFLMFRPFIIYGLLFLGSAALQYFMYTKEIKINLGHVFFLSILIAKNNIVIGIAFLFVTGFLSEVFAGYLEAKTFVAYPIISIIVASTSIFREFDIIYVGILFTFLCYAIIFIAASAVGEPLPEKILEIIMPLIFNLVYFISFSHPLESAINFLI